MLVSACVPFWVTLPALNLDINIFLGSFKLSVQHNSPSKTLTPVIKLAVLKFNTLAVSTNTGATKSVASSYSKIASTDAEVTNQYSLLFCVSRAAPIHCAEVKPKLGSQFTEDDFLFSLVLPNMFSTAPTSEPSDVET